MQEKEVLDHMICIQTPQFEDHIDAYIILVAKTALKLRFLEMLMILDPPPASSSSEMFDFDPHHQPRGGATTTNHEEEQAVQGSSALQFS